jgi:hypothetical protein
VLNVKYYHERPLEKEAFYRILLKVWDKQSINGE